MSKRILAAVDITTGEAREVLDAAVRTARDDDRVHVMMALKPVDVPDVVLEGIKGSLDEIIAAAERYAEARLGELAAEVDIPADRVHLVHGNPAAAVERLAKDLEVSLVVIGKHARQGETRRLGSTASAILNGTPCDVMIVKVS